MAEPEQAEITVAQNLSGPMALHPRQPSPDRTRDTRLCRLAQAFLIVRYGAQDKLPKGFRIDMMLSL
jgi:hypothetical protein